jgi:hypothetical protein
MDTQATASSLAPLVTGVAEENQNGIPDEFVDGATVTQSDLRHLVEVVVEHFGEGIGRHFICGFGEVFDVGEEYAELFSMILQACIASPEKIDSQTWVGRYFTSLRES